MQTASQIPISANHNLPARLAGEVCETLEHLREVHFGAGGPREHGKAFVTFRLAILADHEIVLARKRRNVRLHRAVIDAADKLAAMRSMTALDFACKILAFRAFASTARAYAATANDLAALIIDADAISDLLSAIAADVMAGGEGAL